jgi:hypothetical protein
VKATSKLTVFATIACLSVAALEAESSYWRLVGTRRSALLPIHREQRDQFST